MSKWTQKEIDYLKANRSVPNSIIAKTLGKTEAQVKARFYSLGIKKTTYRIFTDEEKKEILSLYPNTRTQEIAEKFNATYNQIYKFVNAAGIKKDPEFLKKQNKRLGQQLNVNGHAHRFQKGHKSWNKGKSMPVTEAMKKTQFKKGSKPHNTDPVGTIKKISKSVYLKIKVADPNKWELLHRHVWEAANGKIPKDKIVSFKNNDPEDCRIENLELLTRCENMLKNTIHNLPPEIIEVKMKLGALQRMINVRRKKNAEK